MLKICLSFTCTKAASLQISGTKRQGTHGVCLDRSDSTPLEKSIYMMYSGVLRSNNDDLQNQHLPGSGIFTSSSHNESCCRNSLLASKASRSPLLIEPNYYSLNKIIMHYATLPTYF